MPAPEIRALKTHDEFRQCERIQKTVWGNLGVSTELMTVTQKYGGAAIGALLGKKVVGFIYAFLARRDGRLIHWSHMMAVEPAHRDRGLGFRMKLAHRKLALAQGVKSICWTFDPLQSRNAALNLWRLGARVEEYVPDCYGHFPSRIERGLASDRFVVNWRIATRDVERRLRRSSLSAQIPALSRVNETSVNADDFLENRRILLNLRDAQLLVEIPPRTDEMRARALALARRWRFQAREIFERYFSAGYRVEQFLPPSPATGGRCFYLLRRGGAGRA